MNQIDLKTNFIKDLAKLSQYYTGREDGLEVDQVFLIMANFILGAIISCHPEPKKHGKWFLEEVRHSLERLLDDAQLKDLRTALNATRLKEKEVEDNHGSE